MPKVAAGLSRQAAPPPEIPLVIRVGAAGHLHLEQEDAVRLVLKAVFEALQEYAVSTNESYHKAVFGRTGALPKPRIRLVSQLASGLDQLAAWSVEAVRSALDVDPPKPRADFERDAVLPGPCAVFERTFWRLSRSLPTPPTPVTIP